MKSNAKKISILKELSDGRFHSGEELGHKLNISRAAISKHIKGIQEWGLSVYRVQGKGYALSRPIELLCDESIQYPELPRTSILGVVDSTNQYLLNQINTLEKGASCFAEYQSAGRGRRGRHWVSPFGGNIYFSMYWVLDNGLNATIGLSLAIGIAVVNTLETLGCEGLKLKWPNDIYWNEKKLAGILVEVSGQYGGIAHVIIGIGINVDLEEHVSSKIDQPWVDLKTILDHSKVRNQLALELLRSLHGTLLKFEKAGLTSFIERWNQLDNFINREVKLLNHNASITGICRGINAQGAILIEIDGAIKPFFGGDISVKRV